MSEIPATIEQTPYNASLGVQLKKIDDTSAGFYLPFKEENSNPGKALHGGVAASMIDLGGLSLAAHILGDDAGPFHTCGIQVSYLSAAIDEAIVVEATLLRRGKELCFVDTAVNTEDGKPVARGLSTVRGRCSQEVPTPVTTKGDDGAADPGPMGPSVPKRVPFIGRTGLVVEHMADGASRLVMPFKEINGGRQGGVHEGAILALFDTAGAMAAWSVTGPGAYKASTVGLQTQFLAHAEAETLAAYGRVVQRDHEFFWCDVEVATVDGGRVAAKGTVFYRIVVPRGT